MRYQSTIISCIICDTRNATMNQLFFECNITKSLWFKMISWIGELRVVGAGRSRLGNKMRKKKKTQEKGASSVVCCDGSYCKIEGKKHEEIASFQFLYMRNFHFI